MVLAAPYVIRHVQPLDEYRLRLTFADGLVANVDLAGKFTGDVGPTFEPLKDPAYFAQAAVDEAPASAPASCSTSSSTAS